MENVSCNAILIEMKFNANKINDAFKGTHSTEGFLNDGIENIFPDKCPI
jgi:hypothetical protein